MKTVIFLFFLVSALFCSAQYIPETAGTADDTLRSLRTNRLIEAHLLSQNTSAEAKEWARQARNSRITANVLYTAAGACFVGSLVGIGVAETQESLTQAMVFGLGGVVVFGTAGVVFDVGSATFLKRSINAYVQPVALGQNGYGVRIALHF